jgi:hypothetical protein
MHVMQYILLDINCVLLHAGGRSDVQMLCIDQRFAIDTD